MPACWWGRRSKRVKSSGRVIKRIKDFPFQVEMIADSTDEGICCSIGMYKANVADLLGFLVLQRERLVHSLEFVSKHYCLHFSSTAGIRNTCSEIDVNSLYFRGSLSDNGLDYRLLFLLQYYRDGYFAVNHEFD
jgi:hypothetical protein